MKRFLAVLTAVVFLAGCACVNCYAESEINWIITNPYESVDWDTWGNYKFQPHCHTNVSDGYPTIHEFVQNHYDLDYDIVALTDHGTLNRGWNKQPDLIPLVRLIKKERTNMAEINPLTDEEYNATRKYFDTTNMATVADELRNELATNEDGLFSPDELIQLFEGK